jgi:GntR family transcriptional regulator
MSRARYLEIAETLTARINEKTYPIGELIPTELQLADEFHASRQTVRAALRQLQELGLISRKKNVGTRVQATRAARSYSQSLDSLEDLVHLAETQGRRIQRSGEIVVDRALARELGLPPGTRWLQVSSLRGQKNKNKDALPIVWTDVYVDARYRDLKRVVGRYPTKLISDLIESRYGRPIAVVEQEVRGCLIPEELAEPLRTKAGGPGLRITRRYRDMAGELVELSVSVHPADRYAFTMKLRRVPVGGDGSRGT